MLELVNLALFIDLCMMLSNLLWKIPLGKYRFFKTASAVWEVCEFHLVVTAWSSCLMIEDYWHFAIILVPMLLFICVLCLEIFYVLPCFEIMDVTDGPTLATENKQVALSAFLIHKMSNREHVCVFYFTHTFFGELWIYHINKKISCNIACCITMVTHSLFCKYRNSVMLLPYHLLELH